NVRLVDDGTAKLIDLGFAHRVGENAGLVRDGFVLGTANYLAPELCAFAGEADVTSDLFSLGVMLFEMLTGRLPYQPGSTRQTMRRHQCDPPAEITSLLPDLPLVLVRLLEGLMTRHPADRPRVTRVIQQLIALEISTLSRRRSA